MTTLDKLYGSGGKGGGTEKTRGSLEDLFEEEERNKVMKIRGLDAERMYLEKLKELERAKRDLEQLRGSTTPTNAWGGLSTQGQGGSATGLELVNILVKQGMEMQKAVDTIANMDPETLLKLQMISGSPNGMNAMAPLWLFGKQPTVSPMDVVNAAKDLVKTMQPQQSVSPAKDLAEAIAILRPKDESGEAVGYLNEKLDQLNAKLDAEREARHQSDLKHADDLRQADRANMELRLADISKKLDEANNKKTPGAEDPIAYITKTRDDLKALGLVGDVKEASPVDVVNRVTETIMNSPGMNSLLNSAGQRIRERGTGGGPRAAAAQAQQQQITPGQTFFCDVCNAGVPEKGIPPSTRTVLAITPGLAAGREQVTCPRCGTSFAKQGAPGQPPPAGSGSSPPPSGSGSFPGGF